MQEKSMWRRKKDIVLCPQKKENIGPQGKELKQQNDKNCALKQF